MVILYLDIETFSDDEFKLSDTKIISIQYKEVNENIKILKEWESGEKQILNQFYNYLRKYQKNKETIMIIGHNLLRFDIPVLIYRMALYDIDTYGNLIDFFHNTFLIDTMQCLLPFNKFRFRGLGAEKLAKKLEIREPRYSNIEIVDFYKHQQFEKIEEHIKSDINFMEDLWWILKKDQGKLKSL